MQPHPEAHERESDPLVVIAVVAERRFHHERADREQAERDGDRERGDHEHRQAHGAMELRGALARLEPGQVGQDRGLDRLEEL